MVRTSLFRIWFALVLLGGSSPAAADVVFRISHQVSTMGSYTLEYGAGLTESHVMSPWTQTQGPATGSSRWDFIHVDDSSGWNGRNYMRYTRWAKRDGGPNAGFRCDRAKPHPYASIFGDGTSHQCLRFRMRIVKPLTSAGSTQMKWFIVGGGGLADGCDRMIVSFYSGSGGHAPVRGGSDVRHTHLEINSGVCGAPDASEGLTRVLVPNGDWVHVQICWRWGREGTAYQRIYVNNNNIRKPDAEQLQFVGTPANEWTFPVTRTYCGWGDIVSDNSSSNTDAIVDVMDVELDVDEADAFDETWYQGPQAPKRAMSGAAMSHAPVSVTEARSAAISGGKVAVSYGRRPVSVRIRSPRSRRGWSVHRTAR